MKNVMKRLTCVAVALLTSAAAQAELAIVVHPDSPLASMTAEQIAAVYLGTDSRFQRIDLPDSETMHHWFYSKVTGRDANQIKVLRAQQLAKGPPPKVAANSNDAVRRVAANRNAIAYVDKRAVDASVKVVMTVQNPAILDSLSASD